jgi:Tfp pilus assembly protein PilN
MIHINLLGRARPKAPRPAVPLEATLQVIFLTLSIVVAGGILYYDWHSMTGQAADMRSQIRRLNGEKARLEQLKAEVEGSEKQRVVLQQRINIIEELQRNRTGGQELLTAVANTVSRTDTLWLTSLQRKGDALTMQGSAGSIVAVANFITQLRRSGYFDAVEIKESGQDEKMSAVQMFNFVLNAQFTLPQAVPTATTTTLTRTPAPGPAAATPPAVTPASRKG